MSGLEGLAGWLFGRTADGVRWGLDRTRALLAGAGDPHRRFRSVHIGGTNGKGSVAALCEAALREAAVDPARVGLYTSPHLVSFAERVRIGGRPAPEPLILAVAERLRPAIEQSGATFFEATTALAFVCFQEAGVETVVAEVGMGGRLDATNVLEPELVALTNVALDHAEHLGPDAVSIAREKAGIFKPGVPVVTAETDPAVLRVLEDAAAAVGAPLHRLDQRARIETRAVDARGTTLHLHSGFWGGLELRIALPGEHQARNAALAAEALALLPADLRPDAEQLRRGFAAARWPGRLQIEQLHGTHWVLDVAHNPAGAETLARALDALELPRPRVLLMGVLADKHWQQMLPPLLAGADGAVFSVPGSAPPARRWDPQAAAEWARAEGLRPPARVIPDLEAALQRAGTLAPHGTVVVTGSSHTVGDALAALGLPVA